MALGIQYTENFGRDKQPYLYNGKEFVEAHGQGFYVHLSRKYFVGDSVTISSTGKEDTILPITQKNSGKHGMTKRISSI